MWSRSRDRSPCCLRDRIRREVLETYLRDTSKARLLRPDGSYIRADEQRFRGKLPPPFTAQDFLISLAEGRATLADLPPSDTPPFRRATRLKSEAAL